jgi:predicted helicase
MDIRNIKSIDDLIIYFTEELNWNIDLDDFDEIDDITYDFDAADIGLKEEAFAKITSLRQLQPLCDEQKWGIFCVEFDSNKFEVSALRKILSGLIPKRRNAADHAVWAQKDLLFLCFWGTDNNRTIGIAHFEDKDTGLPQIKMISCAPAVEDFTQIRIFEERIGHLSWVKDVTDTQAWYDQWSAAFVTAYHQVIRDSASLTVKLAAEAQAIRDRILDIYAVETHDGYVHKLFKDFKDNLIHDMTKQQFADMYAQTVVYGLFSARCMDKTQGDFNVQEAIKCIPTTNPFLKRLMEECLGESSERHLTFDELEVANVVEILTHTNTDLILADFNRQTGGGREDPVIHFYEEFLTAYDKGQKVDRGVFYTPQPVVNFIVRAVDSILKNDLGLEDGLASEQTKDIMIEVEGKKRRERREVPAVQILDPATGTGTFLRQTILQIYDNFKAKHKGESAEQIKKAWNEYVPKHLLPRLNGFELMMAPYAVAHMKLAMVLKDTGYDFSGDQRLNVFLTNSLEEAGKDDFQMTLFDNDPLAFESIEANQAKKNNGINVIIGNPPYNVSSNNKNPWISDLIQEYKRGLSERKLNLDDDYIKFLRLAQTIVEGADKGVVGFITNNSFIDGITHRQIRKSLANTFDKIYIINLHGNIMAHEKCPDGSKDENVFPITQGVSIFIGVRNKAVKEKGAYHIDLMGTRDYKFNWLNQNIIDEIRWSALSLDDDKCMFVPVDTTSLGAYKDGFNVDALFRLYNSGIQTKCDELSVKNTESELQEIIDSFLENDVESLKRLYPNKSDSSGWSFEKAKGDLLQGGYIITPYYYRPFDFKYTVYTGRSSGFIGRSRDIVMKHIINHPENSSLCLMKQFFQDITYNHVFITTMPIDERTLYSNRGGTYLFPLYLYSSELGENKKEYNFNSGIISKIEHSLGLKLAYSIQENHFTGENLIDYIYAVLYSNKYRLAYNDFLKVDFPRVPYPTDQETFWKLVEIGGKLRECHLMQTEFDTAPYSFTGDGTNEIVKPEYKNGRVYISKTQYFDNVPQAQWEQYIGGYQPLQKWLKDRKKTALSAEDIEHYKKIIAALRLTEELMAEIDQVVEF